MAEPDDVEDPKAGAPAEGQDGANETGAPEGEQPEEQAESLEDKLARLEQQLAEERRHKKQAQKVNRHLMAEIDGIKSTIGVMAAERAESQRSSVLQSAQGRVAAAEAKLAEAHEAGESKAVAAAQRELAEAVAHASRVTTEYGDDDGDGRSRSRPRQAETRQQPQQQAMPPATQTWLGKNAWYGNQQDPKDRRDSMLAHRLMETVAQDTGLTPDDPDFWREVDSAIKESLPHRAAAPQPRQQTQQRPAPNSAGAGRAVTPGRASDMVDGIPRAALEAARVAGKPVDDPKWRANFKKYTDETARNMGIIR